MHRFKGQVSMIQQEWNDWNNCKTAGKWRKYESYFGASTRELAAWAVRWKQRLPTLTHHPPQRFMRHHLQLGRIGSAPVQMNGCCLGAALSWLRDGLLWGLVVPYWRFSLKSHFGHFRAWSSACSSTGALLHRYFSSNLSTTTQGAIVKLRGAFSELCSLFIGSVWNSKIAFVRGPRTVLGYVGKKG